MDDLRSNLRKAAETMVGLGLLGMQRLQSQRPDFGEQFRDGRSKLRSIEPRLGEVRDRLADFADRAEQLLTPVVEEVNAQLDHFQESLPDHAREMLARSRSQMESAANAVRERLRPDRGDVEDGEATDDGDDFDES